MNPVLADLDGNINIAMVKLINTTIRTTIHVAVGIIPNAKGQVLIAKRPDHWLGGGFWEFPGGKIEPDEDSLGALKRELLEEVGIIVEECSPLIHLTYSYPERTVVLYAWTVHSYKGIASGLEGQEIAWQDPQSLNNINMLPANRAVVTATQLPDIYLITPDSSNSEEFIQSLKQTLQEQKIKLLQLRVKNLPVNDYIQLAKETSQICKKMDVILLLNHEQLDVINDVNADGIHLRSDQLKTLIKRPLPKDKWVGASCHTEEDIAKAEEIDVDFIVISPVQFSPNKSPPLGWEQFSHLVEKANLPVYALGGMSVNDLSLAKKCGAQGIAGIRSFWNY